MAGQSGEIDAYRLAHNSIWLIEVSRQLAELWSDVFEGVEQVVQVAGVSQRHEETR